MELFKIWSLFILAWATALGTLIYKSPQKVGLLTFSIIGLILFSTTWVIIFIALWRLTDKLKFCKED
jgi:hypothetical protein